MNKKKNILCILGGMGPDASAHLYSLINKLAVYNYGAKDNNDFPEIILYSIPIPDFIGSIEQQDKAMGMLQERVKGLSTLSISCFSLACNTAHILLKDLQRVTSIPFISMIDIVVAEIKKKNIKTVGILASPVSIQSNLYQIPLRALGIKIVFPKRQDLQILETIIRNILREQRKKIDKAKIVAIADSLCEKGAEGILLGCTEIPLIFPRDYPATVFNSLEILATTLLNKYYRDLV